MNDECAERMSQTRGVMCVPILPNEFEVAIGIPKSPGS